VTAVPHLVVTDLSDGSGPDRPLLVVGPSLGTAVGTLWGSAAAELAGRFHVVGFDLPGHGASQPAAGFDVPGLAAGVLRAVDDLLGAQGRAGATFHYAGDSVGGAVGLQLLLDVPDRVTSATLLCTGARLGEPAAWHERARSVRQGGTEVMLASTPGRWFGPGFADRDPAVAQALLDDLSKADADSYATVCEALAAFDVRDRLHEIATPVLAVAGDADVPTPTARLRHVADGVRDGRLVVLEGVAHVAPAERPDLVAALITEQAERAATPAPGPTTSQVRAAGMRVRREVLGDEHVDRASANATDFTAEFQDLITQYAWGGIWTRPGLDRRSRSLITLTALVARGHHEELAMHVRAARTNGLTDDEIKELLLQTAIYCGVPDANTAFRIAQRVLADLDAEAAEAPTSEPRPTHDQPTSEM
jgi:3-oxoadipate enol-lactonase/4-carboxymuconolactone decarboxylase